MMSPNTEPLEDAPEIDERSSDFRISEYWAILVQHRRLIFLCVAFALAVGVLISVLSKPSYLAIVTLSVERERSNPVDANWTPQIYSGVDPEFLPTQTQLIKSREIAERAVERLGLMDNRELNPKRSGLFQGGKQKGGSTRGDTNRLVRQVRDKIQVTPAKGTSLIELSYAGPSPQLAAEIANALAEAYIAWNLEAKSQLVGQASEFLKSQIEQLRQEIGGKERQLLAYGRQKDIISADPQSNVTLQKLGAFNSSYAAAVSERVAAEARYHEARNARAEDLAERAASGLAGQLRAEQIRLEREYAEKQNLYKPEWPAMQQLKEQIEKGRQHLNGIIQESAAKQREAARSDYMAALRREEGLKGLLNTQKSEAQELTSDSVEFNSLHNELQTKKLMLETLLKRQAETQILSRLAGERSSSIRIVDRATPPSTRFKPSYQKNFLLALASGGFLGIGLAFALSFLDRSLRSVEQVEQNLQLPALGVIPAVGPSEKGYGYIYGPKLSRKNTKEDVPSIELLPHEHSRSRVAERYRAFRTALLLSRAGGVHSIVVTSCFSREGKTATAVNLAVVLGQLGKRVLLVDADLHRPRLHEIFHVSNRGGLVAVLAENHEPAREIIKTEVPGVFLVPAGPSAPNPSGLLSSEAMSKFLELARMNFDYVILDTPPVIPVTDAVLLGHQTDGIVLCVKAGETPREQVARVRDKLTRSNVRILGVLLNSLSGEDQRYEDRYDRYESYYAEGAGDFGKETASAARTV